MADGDFKDLARRTALDKVLRDKACHIAKNPENDRYQRGLASTVYKLFEILKVLLKARKDVLNGFKSNLFTTYFNA